MPAFIHGKSTKVYVNGYDVSGMLSSTSSAGEVDATDVTAYGTGDKQYIAGLTDARLSHEGFVAGGTAETDAVFSALLGMAGTAGASPVVETVWPYGDAAGQSGWGMYGDLVRYDITDDVGDAVKLSTELQSSTGFDRPVSLRALALATGAGTVAAVDFTTAGSIGAVFYAQAMNGTVGPLQGTVTVESSTTQGGAYTAHGTVVLQGTAAGGVPGAVGAGYVVIPSGVTINRWVRVNLVAWGTASLTASIHRR